MKETTEITIGDILIIHTGWFRVVDITEPRHTGARPERSRLLVPGLPSKRRPVS